MSGEHYIADELNTDDLAVELVVAIEDYLAKHAAFHDFLGE